jgi:hypothetical protein
MSSLEYDFEYALSEDGHYVAVSEDDIHRFLLQLRIQYKKDRILFESVNSSSSWTFIKHPDVKSKYNFIKYENNPGDNLFNIRCMLYIAYMAYQSPAALMQLIVNASAKASARITNYYQGQCRPGMLIYALQLLENVTIDMTPELDLEFTSLIYGELMNTSPFNAFLYIPLTMCGVDQAVICINIDDELLSDIYKMDNNREFVVWHNINFMSSIPVTCVDYNCCWHCHKIAQCQICTRCKLARYCSKECQIADWMNIHKKYCLQLTKE